MTLSDKTCFQRSFELFYEKAFMKKKKFKRNQKVKLV